MRVVALIAAVVPALAVVSAADAVTFDRVTSE